MYPGHINPKYIVLGIVYSPPGKQSTVTYSNQTAFGNTTTTSSSFSIQNTTSVSLNSSQGIPGFLSGKESTTLTNSYTQQTGSSNSLEVNHTQSNSISVKGFTDNVAGLNHDYDYIFVWLNPIAAYTVTANPNGTWNVAWNGYGFDMTDTNAPNDMDVIGIPVGCLDGDFASDPSWQPTCNSIDGVLARSWALSNTDGSGPGLTDTDKTNILHADPFWTSYTPVLAQGSLDTTDGRFMECGNQNCSQTIDFEPNLTESYTQGYSLTSTDTTSYSHTEAFAVEQEFSTSIFWETFGATLKNTTTFTWQYSNNKAVKSSTTDTGSFTIVGPDPGYTGPLQFVAFEDKYFGTFMFFHY